MFLTPALHISSVEALSHPCYSICFAPSRPVLAVPACNASQLPACGTYLRACTMGNGEIVNGHGPMTLQKALDIARDNESGVDPSIYAFLQRELQSVWSKLLAQPDDYVFTRDEFGLFNYFRQQYTGNEVATKAVQRFWNHYRNADPASRG